MMMRRAWQALLIVVTASGCDRLFQLDPIDPQRDGAVADVPATDGAIDGGLDANRFCAMASLLDDFTGGTPACQPWAQDVYMDFGSTITESGGALVITPGMQTNSVAGCISPPNAVQFGPGGVIVEVSQIARGPATYNVLAIIGPNLQILATGDDTLTFQDTANVVIGGVATYSPEKRWWRIKPEGSSAISGAYSSDRVNWVTLGQTNTVVPTQVTVHLSAGTNTTSVTGAAKFESVESCP